MGGEAGPAAGPWRRRWLQVLWVLLQLVPLLMLRLLQLLHICSPSEPKKLGAKVVMVTGAGQGLGRELARQLGRMGCTVLLADLNASALEATRAMLAADVVPVRAYVCDVADRAGVLDLADRARADVGRVDVLVNNAGILDLAVADGADWAQQAERLLRVNLLSHVWMIQAFLPGMLERRQGHIVAISSAAALFGIAGAAVYASSKAGIAGLMLSLAEELRVAGRTDIKTTTVFPTVIRTANLEASQKLPPTALSVEHAAAEIIRGVREEQVWLTLPRGLLHRFLLTRIVPDSIAQKLQAMSAYNFLRGSDQLPILSMGSEASK